MARAGRRTTTGGEAAAGPGVPNAFRAVWWLPVLRGILLVVLGLLVMIQPLERLEVLRVVVGAFVVVDGVVLAVLAVVHRRQVGWAWWLAQAAVDVVLGAVVLAWPGLGPTALYYVLVVWMLVLGIVTVVGAAALARNRDLTWSWALALGIVAALFGLLLVTRPLEAEDALGAVVVAVGLFAFVAGALCVVSGFAVRAVARELSGLREQAVAAGVAVTGGSVLAASASAPEVAEPRAAGPEHVPEPEPEPEPEPGSVPDPEPGAGRPVPPPAVLPPVEAPPEGPLEPLAPGPDDVPPDDRPEPGAPR